MHDPKLLERMRRMMREMVGNGREFVENRVADMQSPSELPAALMNPNPSPEQREVLMGSTMGAVGSVGGPAKAIKGQLPPGYRVLQRKNDPALGGRRGGSIWEVWEDGGGHVAAEHDKASAIRKAWEIVNFGKK